MLLNEGDQVCYWCHGTLIIGSAGRSSALRVSVETREEERLESILLLPARSLSENRMVSDARGVVTRQ